MQPSEAQALQKTTAPFLYTRYFDIDKAEGKFLPVAVIAKDSAFNTTKTIVPVVFITNRVFINITKDEVKFLAANIYNLVQKKTSELNVSAESEIQIDCDWTAGTRDDFFSFLKELQAVSKQQVTSTLRLHQVKDKAAMGIPPVSKVYLMCYATSSPLENSSRNSILDVTILKNYLAAIDTYPIKNMDVALPIYSWGIVTNHLGKHKLINALSVKDLQQPAFKKLTDNTVEVLEDGFYFGNFISKGFTIKFEEISNEQLKEVIEYLDGKISKFNIVYYQLDAAFIEGRSF